MAASVNVSNSKVKESIVQLCRLIKHAGLCSGINPDCFRQAKLDHPEMVDTFVNLLSSVIKFSSWLPAGINNFSTDAITDSFSIQDIVREMEKFAYPRANILKSWPSPSSKELLLCFGWLIHSTYLISSIKDNALQLPDVFQLLLHKKQKSIQEKFSTVDRKQVQQSQHRVYSDATVDRHGEFESLSIADQMQYISCLVRKIEMLSNSLLALEVCNGKLDAQKNQSMSDLLCLVTDTIYIVAAQIMLRTKHGKQQDQRGHSEYLTANETLLIKHSALLQLCEEELERKIQVLQAYVKWKDLEPVFWQWMERLLDKESIDDDITDDDSLCAEDCPRLEKQISIARDLLENVKTTLFVRQKSWLDAVKNDPEKLSKLRTEQKHQIDKDVQALLSQVHNIHNSPKITPYRETEKAPQATSVGSLPASYELSRLREKSKELSLKLREMEHLCVEELTMILNTSFNGKAIIVQPAAAIR